MVFQKTKKQSSSRAHRLCPSFLQECSMATSLESRGTFLQLLSHWFFKQHCSASLKESNDKWVLLGGRPLGTMAKGEGRKSTCSDAVTATTAEVMQKHCYNIDRVSRALSYCVICLCKISSGLHFRRPLLVLSLIHI